jgi:hypothetical protein
MTHCTFLVPDLLPAALRGSPARGLHAPRLAVLLARGDATALPAGDTDDWLCEAFGVARRNDRPVAVLTLAGDGGEPGNACWLRCDPVHLYMRQNGMILSDAAGTPTAEESQTLVNSLNAHFVDDGLLFFAGNAGRWYVRSETHSDLTTQPLTAALNRDIDSLMPTGADSRYWRRILNEAQMLLHAHPLNAEREARGLPAFNSVWLWGGGTMPATVSTNYSQLWADEALARALALRSGIQASPLPDSADAVFAAGGNALVVVTALRDNTPDLESWQQALEKFEQQWMAPCHAALKSGRMQRLTLLTPGTPQGKRFDISAAHLWRWWRHVKSIAAHV